MTDPSARTFSSDFKRFFVRGLVILLPSVLTLWIVVEAYQFVNDAVAKPINGWLQLGMVELAPYWKPLRDQFDPTPDQIAAAVTELGAKTPATEVLKAQLRASNIEHWWTDHWYTNIIGLIVAIVAVYVAGRLLGGFVGRYVYKYAERLITSLPIFKQVYPYVKQIVDFLFGEDKQIKFSRVVLVEYPRKGIWSMGFVTGGSFGTLADRAGDAVTVFIPSSPTPFTGYTITLPGNEVIDLPITVEEAIRFCVSGGVLMPDNHIPVPLFPRLGSASPPTGEAAPAPSAPIRAGAPIPATSAGRGDR